MTIRSLVAAVTLALAAVVSASPAAAQASLDNIRADWRARKYPQTYEATEEYRKQPYGKQLEVYYMGGTSLCRIQGDADLGTKYMQWILDNFWLTRKDIDTVQQELAVCRTATAPSRLPVYINFATTMAVAGSSGRTKMFYFVGGNNALKSEPVQIVREVPRDELDRRLFREGQTPQAKDAVRRLIGANGRSEASKHFAVASTTHSVEQLRSIGEQLDTVYDFFIARYGMRAPETLISVYLVPNASAFQALSVALHGIKVSPQSIGYSYQADMSMVGIIPGPQIGTLQHELFHLMVRNDFGDIPPWLDEGMAALYEVAQVGPDEVRGLPNWRGQVLSELSGLQPSVEQLIKMNWFAFSGGEQEFNTERQAAQHAKARYLILYLQNQGMLVPVYRAFQSREIGSDPVALLSATLKKPLPAVESDFQAWFKTMPR